MATPALEIAAGLHALASIVEDNPTLAEEIRHSLDLCFPVGGASDPKATIAAFARAALRVGGTVEKDFGDWAGVRISLGPVGLFVYAKRELVCERVVVGTETVTTKVPDPAVEVPLVEVTEEVERVEWRCTPLLAEVGEPDG